VIAHFASRARLLAECSPSPVASASHSNALEGLISTLRARQVSLLVSGLWLSGRLIQTSPVTLVDQSGEVTVIDERSIEALRF
jgi:hypothetical protein